MTMTMTTAAVVAVADEHARAWAAELEGATVRLGDGATLPEGAQLVVAEPGLRPDHPLPW